MTIFDHPAVWLTIAAICLTALTPILIREYRR